MRVIAGSHRGRRLSGPRGVEFRPTSDKVREALFSILGSRIVDASFLDLYAGTGAVGIEALSRGASAVTLVESHPAAVQLLTRNVETCGMKDRTDIRKGRVDVFLARQDWWRGPYQIAFADPPYASTGETEPLYRLWRGGLMTDDGVLVLEQSSRTTAPAIDHATLLRRYEYGDTALLLYGPAERGTSPR
ncbi:putative Ribosomal RNA small subunit methyltransferase D [Nitrospira sp. KM1]|uniref:16S rRNA (guanine(966)-N(2))-methyltransferase RsmD n=1 Tax=Nitrospira sp. KM1 TaxID=1936990 RepID=UPI0013A75EE9|nr:16S rRNA (guanine(966)-N(2))-methyltransferase RsmD [Nitrospira sp. KM1]BCA53438.1 putative Ribosomal RNA small subunit methyltransferase D [Nitrospira sp. KM1]